MRTGSWEGSERPKALRATQPGLSSFAIYLVSNEVLDHLKMESLALVMNVLEVGKAAWAVSAALYELYKDTKRVNKTIEDLVSETKALSHACDNIQVELEEVIGDAGREVSINDKNGTLWPQIEQQTADCQIPIEELSLLVNTLREEGSTFFKQGTRQVRLNSYDDDFAKIRVHIPSHTQSLQAVLLVVNMCKFDPNKAW